MGRSGLPLSNGSVDSTLWESSMAGAQLHPGPKRADRKEADVETGDDGT